MRYTVHSEMTFTPQHTYYVTHPFSLSNVQKMATYIVDFQSHNWSQVSGEPVDKAGEDSHDQFALVVRCDCGTSAVLHNSSALFPFVRYLALF